MFTSHDAESKATMITRQGGGATVCKTNKAYLIGTWDKTVYRGADISIGGFQLEMTEGISWVTSSGLAGASQGIKIF